MVRLRAIDGACLYAAGLGRIEDPPVRHGGPDALTRLQTRARRRQLDAVGRVEQDRTVYFRMDAVVLVQ